MIKLYLKGLLITALFCLIACEQKEQEYELKEFQGLSLLGDSLKIPERSASQLEPLMAKLNEAKANFEADPSEMNTIWLGRRYAYLSDYLKAIDVFSEGLEKFPNSHKLYRHRGHRYISLRQFDKAISDFEKAYELMPKGTMDIEPDGAPNKLNIPLSNTQFNILYHYGLAHYLKGDFEKAEQIYSELLQNYCDNPDLVVATVDWLYMTLRRQDKNDEALDVAELILPEMEIIENDSYMKRIQMYQGKMAMEELFKTDNDDAALSLATQGYGVANWYLYNGDIEKAKEILNRVLSGTSWAAFGYVAAEADMARLR